MKRIICTTLLVETSPQAMPLGAACIASALKADSRIRDCCAVSLQDFSLEDDSLASLPTVRDKALCIARSLAEQKPDCVCFSVYVWNHLLLEQASRALKELLPAVRCIAGGPEVTAAPTAFNTFDYTIAGQGECAVPALIYELFFAQQNSYGAQQHELREASVPGVYSLCAATDAYTPRAPETVAKNGDVTRAVPLFPQQLASPYLDGTLDPARYGGALWELARGCPFKCSYCYESKGEQKIAYFPLERLEKELELFAKKDIAQVFVLDPTYNANKQRALTMLRLIEKKAPGIFFYFEARAEFIDRELSRAFSRIPCALQIGLQSADVAVLKNVHRTLDKKLFTKNIGFLNEAGVTFGFDVIYGLPGDSYAGFCRSIDFALSLYPNNLELFCLSVLPGTTLHDDAAGFGMQWQQEPPYHVICTPQFGERELSRAARLSRATQLFYNEGRAVPWFNSILYPLQKKPAAFLEDFAAFLETRHVRADQDCDGLLCSHADIERLQCAFVEKAYRAQHLTALLPAALDLIRMNGAVSRATADGAESLVPLSYHPNDIMSEYALDIAYFTEICGRQTCCAHVFVGKNGVDWDLTEKQSVRKKR